MGEKTPDTDESGIERRNVLKGLGFGAVGLAGVGAFAGSAAAGIGSPVNAGITLPGEDLEDDEITPPELTAGEEYDLVVYAPMTEDQNVVAKQLAMLTRNDSPPKIVDAFEEGTAEAAVTRVKTNANGIAEFRERFTVPDALSSGSYVVSLTLHDFTTIKGLNEVPSGDKLAYTLKGVNASEFRQVIAHRFDVK